MFFKTTHNMENFVYLDRCFIKKNVTLFQFLNEMILFFLIIEIDFGESTKFNQIII